MAADSERFAKKGGSETRPTWMRGGAPRLHGLGEDQNVKRAVNLKVRGVWK